MAQAMIRTRAELAAEYLELDSLFAALVKNCSREQLVWRPASGAWSMAECVEHVARTNSLYVPPIKSTIAGSRAPMASNDEPLTTAGWFSAFFLNSVSPQGNMKLKSPPSTRPVSIDPSSIDPEDSLRKLVATHQEIRQLLESTAQLNLNRLRFKNPFVPLVRFTVGTGLLIMAAHGRRHLLQAQRVAGAPGFPKSEAAARQPA